MSVFCPSSEGNNAYEPEIEAAIRRQNRLRYEWLREHFKFANDSMQELWFDADCTSDDSSELDRAIDTARGVGRGSDA